MILDAANKKPNENPYWHEFLRSVVEFDNRIKSKFNGRKSFAISTYGSLKYLTNQGRFSYIKFHINYMPFVYPAYDMP